ETEMFLEQPQGDIVARKVPAAAAAATTTDTGLLRQVIGSYQSESSNNVIEIGERDGKVSLVVPGQPPYALVESEKDKLRSPGLPEAYWIEVKRDEKGEVSSIVLNQPEGRFTLRRLKTEGSNKLISADDLIE